MITKKKNKKKSIWNKLVKYSLVQYSLLSNAGDMSTVGTKKIKNNKQTVRLREAASQLP